MSVAFETVVIVIVVISFTVLAAIVVGLYWLWRLLLEDRRCALVNNSSGLRWHRRGTPIPGFTLILPPTSASRPAPDDIEHRECLTGDRFNNPLPQISRGTDLLVDERSFRMTRSKRPSAPQKIKKNSVAAPEPDVVVLDDTEPPPPYERS